MRKKTKKETQNNYNQNYNIKKNSREKINWRKFLLYLLILSMFLAVFPLA